jgi:hypothetical protein
MRDAKSTRLGDLWMKRVCWTEITYFYNGQIGSLFGSTNNLYRINHAETCALVFALTLLPNLLNRREILMTCSELQGLAVVQTFFLTHIFEKLEDLMFWKSHPIVRPSPFNREYHLVSRVVRDSICDIHIQGFDLETQMNRSS